MNDSTPPGAKASLAQRILRAASFNVVGLGMRHVIRLVTNVVLLRFFIPKGDVGLMAVIIAVNVGLEMLSDVGIGPAIIQNEHADDQDFLNTAWTLQVMRGAVLTLVALLLVYPVAMFQGMPELLELMPVSALTGVIVGFHSTSVWTLRRRIAQGRLAAMELMGQACGSGATILIATIEPSAWALVWGGLVRAVVDLIISHAVPVGYRNRFAWHREHLDSLLHFGKWLFGSSVLTFMAGEGHKLVVARPLDKVALGVYSVADLLAGAPMQAIMQLVSEIGYPAFSEVARDRPAELKRLYYRMRRVIDAVAQPVFGALSALGPELVLLLYGEEFADAGWMLRILCVRNAVEAVAVSGQYCLLAQGATRYSFFMNLGRAVTLVCAAVPAYNAYGVAGVVWVVAAVEIPALVTTLVGMKRHGTLSPLRELLAPVMFFVGGGIGWVARPVVPWIGEVARGLFAALGFG